MTDKQQEMHDPLVFKEQIIKENKILNNLFNLALILGSFGFFYTGILSYFNNDAFGKTNITHIIFYPQGLTMCIYGLFGIIISISLMFNEYSKFGEGYNEFNKKTGEIKIYRKRNNNNIYIKYKINDIVPNENCYN
jgi:hypothetical protein